MITTLVLSIAASFVPAAIGYLFTKQEIKSSWYLQKRPSFTPPQIVFPIVWNILYLLLGISLFLTLIKKQKNKNVLVYLFAANLVLNALWPILFFKYQWFILGFLDIVMMIGVSIAIATLNKSLSASLLLIPYIIWLCFAGVLNLYFAYQQ